MALSMGFGLQNGRGYKTAAGTVALLHTLAVRGAKRRSPTRVLDPQA
jgi:hypothetical protein